MCLLSQHKNRAKSRKESGTRIQPSFVNYFRQSAKEQEQEINQLVINQRCDEQLQIDRDLSLWNRLGRFFLQKKMRL